VTLRELLNEALIKGTAYLDSELMFEVEAFEKAIKVNTLYIDKKNKRIYLREWNGDRS